MRPPRLAARAALLAASLAALPAWATVSVSPTTSTNGSYTVSWTDTGGRLYLAESKNGAAATKVIVTGTSRAYTGKTDGSYAYQVEVHLWDAETGVYRLEYKTNVATVVVSSLAAPGVPGAVSAPASSSTGSYTVSWGAATGTVTRYELYENGALAYSGTALSASISGKADGTYSYRAQACNAAGCSAQTPAVAVTVLRPPGVPAVVGARTGGPDYTISWGAASGTVASYELQESPDNATWAAKGGSALTVTGKPVGTWYYRVRACNSSGCSAWAATTYTVTTYLSGPTQSSGTYALTWAANGGDLAQLEERQLPSGTFAQVYKGSGLTTWTFTRTVDGVWEHRLRYCVPAEPGIPETCQPYGAVHTVDTQLPPSTPGAMSASVNQATGSYTVNWGASTGAAVGYWLEKLNGASWVEVPGNPRTTLSYTASGVADGSYTHRVRACNRSCSAYAGPVTVTVLRPPSGVSGLTASVAPATGLIRLAWTAATGSVTRYVVTETGTLLGGTPRTRTLYATTPALDVSTLADGTFTYGVAAENATGQGGAASTAALTMLRIPSAPPSIQAPATSSGAFTVTWARPAPASPATGYKIDAYVLETSCGGGAWSPKTLSPPVESYSEVRLVEGSTCSYRVSARNGSGTGPPSVLVSVSVPAISLTEALPDAPVDAPSPPAQGWVGTLPGAPSTDGGAAGYRIDIEVPPGRAGMQPHLALTYSSRGGNGIAGVGWSLSGTGSIYRCPRTLAQDGASRPVRLDGEDRLCMNGQRLVPVSSTAAYGAVDTKYVTEVDPFDRVTIGGGGMASWDSWIEVEHRSGKVSRFRPLWDSAFNGVPDTWRLVVERDRQDNCIAYSYVRFPSSVRNGGRDEEWLLGSISYTGRASADGGSCLAGGERRVAFEYSADRPDKRTTYAYGSASILTARLAAITTRVGVQPVRRYELAYKVSGATGRSLLESVTLCAGSACGLESLPATRFEYEEARATFAKTRFSSATGSVLGAPFQVSLGGDYDGDGQRDLKILDNDAATRSIQLTKCGTDTALSGTPWFEGFDNPAYAGSNLGGADLDGDGRVDLLGTVDGLLAIGTRACEGWQAPLVTSLRLFPSGTAPPFTTAASGDYDGDGLADVSFGDPETGQPRVFRRTSRTALDFDDGTHIRIPQAQGTEERVQMVRDINGDGLVDWLFDGTKTTDVAEPQVAFAMGLDSPPVRKRLWEDLSGPRYSFVENAQRRWIDVNGDGLPDIYEPGTIWLNRGGAPGPGMFWAVPISAQPVLDPRRSSVAFTMDVDADGRDELLVPTVRTIAYCGGDPTKRAPDGGPYFWCGDEFDGAFADDSFDKSVFLWNAYRFREKDDGSYQMELMAPNVLEAPVRYPFRHTGDYYGDGLTDVSYRLRNQYETDSAGRVWTVGQYQVAEASLGPWLSQNLAPAPDLMKQVTNGMGAKASWTHQPLSRALAPAGCDQDPQKPFYVADHLGQRSPGHVFFTSSMWAVSKMEVSDGLGGMNPTCYRYEDAMLNTWGRGFQGFKKIVAEDRLPPAAGEVAGVAGTCAGGALCSANNLRTTTEFLQEFPLTNRVKRVKVERASDARLLSDASTTWSATASPSVVGAWVVYPAAEVEKKYDLAAGTLLSTTISIRDQMDLVAGEPARTCTIVEDASRPNADTTRLAVAQEDRVFTNDTPAWWLAKLSRKTITQDFRAAAFTDPLPAACPVLPGTAGAKVHGATYTWHPQRNLESEALFSGPPPAVPPTNCTPTPELGTAEARTCFAYDQYGNTLRKAVTARGVAGTLTTTLTYTADGYFARTETSPVDSGSANPLGHTSTVETDPATGQPMSRRAVVGGPLTTFQYDALGRLLTTATDGAQPVHERIAGTTPAVCGAAVLSRQRIQAGSPTVTEHLDCLGRPMWTETQGFGNERIVATRVERNARGAKVTEYAPYEVKAAEAPTLYATRYSSIDALGRVGRKEVERDVKLIAAGKGDALLKTDYTHTGFRTAITVLAGTGTTQRDMSRTYDARGRLRETTQRITGGNTRDVASWYAYDPAGNLVSLETGTLSPTTGAWITGPASPAAARLTATYDHLGRKTAVADPDRGTWRYDWDGLGRLLKQTDAKLTEQTLVYDGMGRPTSRSTKASGQSPPVVDATWGYDENGKPGTLSWVVGTDGGNVTTDDFRRDYTYDGLFRPEKEVTAVGKQDVTAGGGPRVFTILRGYDRNHGRPKGMRYPGGEIVAFDYGPRGHAKGETEILPDGARGRNYRQVTAMTVRGQVTDQTLGNGVVETTHYDDSAGLAIFLSATRPLGSPNPLVRQVEYAHDHFLNLQRQAKNVAGVQSVETYTYDELQRLTGAERSWAGAMSGTEGDSYAYDDLGNVTSKSDYGTSYSYGAYPRPASNAGPHAVASVTKVASAGGGTATFAYDLNGNQTSGDGRTIVFDLMDRVASVTQAATATTTEFAYAPDGARYRQVVSGGAEAGKFGPKTVYYVDKDHELSVWGDGTTEERSYVGGAVIYRKGGVREVRYQHLDRLGSLDAVTADDAAATELMVDAHGYDPWGKPRGQTWTSSQERLHPAGDRPAQKVTTDRGFTGHEHLDVHWLIHMNGRVYDYRLGRFLSVDPIISNPANPQAVNPYSYIGNNPLSGTDPTGYDARSICDGTGGSGNCSRGQANPNEVIGFLVLTITKFADGTTTTRVSIQPSSGMEGQGPTLATMDAQSKGAPGETAAKGPSAIQLGMAFLAGFAKGALPLGSFLPTPGTDDPDILTWFAYGEAAGAGVQAGRASGEATSGGGLILAGAGTGGATAVPGGGLLALGLAEGAEAGVKVSDAIKTLDRAKEMRGKGDGGGGKPNQPMLGERGTQVTSKTVWKGDGARIDVENPSPGQRPGQIHVQVGKDKYLYDPATNSFRNAPRSVNALLERQDVQVGIGKAMRILGEAR